MLPYRAHEIPVTPKLASPQLLLHFRAQPKDFSSSDTLDDLHDLLRTVHWHRLHQKVHVVFVCPYLNKRHLVPLADLQAGLFDLLVHGGVKTTLRYFAGQTMWYSSTETLWLLW